jgi:1,4-alpha-glucan branching enzyme
MITKAQGRDRNTVWVTFHFPASVWAEDVRLLGDMNHWAYPGIPLVRSRDNGDWSLTLELQRGREYRFFYLINDAMFCNDAQADEYLGMPIPFAYKGYASVVST